VFVVVGLTVTELGIFGFGSVPPRSAVLNPLSHIGTFVVFSVVFVWVRSGLVATVIGGLITLLFLMFRELYLYFHKGPLHYHLNYLISFLAHSKFDSFC